MGKKATVPDNVDDDDALDMFAENLDGDKKKEEVAAATVKEDPVLDDVSLGDIRFLFIFCGWSRWAGSSSGSLRMWNCMGLTPVKRCSTGRWETLNDSLTLIHTLFFSLGSWPFKSFLILVLFPQESGFFDAGILVRKVGTEEFRDSKRIDFELYV